MEEGRKEGTWGLVRGYGGAGQVVWLQQGPLDSGVLVLQMPHPRIGR